MGITFEQAGYTPVPAVGDWIELDNHATGNLQACDDWDRADFRFPVTRLEVPHAVNVQVTGRTLQRRYSRGVYWTRVQVTFVGDGEPDQILGGWLLPL